MHARRRSTPSERTRGSPKRSTYPAWTMVSCRPHSFHSCLNGNRVDGARATRSGSPSVEGDGAFRGVEPRAAPRLVRHGGHNARDGVLIPGVKRGVRRRAVTHAAVPVHPVVRLLDRLDLVLTANRAVAMDAAVGAVGACSSSDSLPTWRSAAALPLRRRQPKDTRWPTLGVSYEFLTAWSGVPQRVSFVLSEGKIYPARDDLTAGWRQSPPVLDLLGEEDNRCRRLRRYDA